MRLRSIVLPAVWVGALLLAVSAPGQAAGLWPYKDSAARARQHKTLTLHNVPPRTVKPVGLAEHAVKPVGTNRKPPRTILSRRP